MNHKMCSGPELLELVRQFDPKALALIYDAYSPGIYRYAMRWLGDENLAEDCVAETFSRLLQALQAERGPESYLQAYLYRMAHNWIVDQYRKHPVQPLELTEEIRDENSSPEEDTGRNLRKEELQIALRKLTPDQQQVIALKYLEGWENEEIALSLDKPVGAVKSLQHRALASLQRMLISEELP
jgi:RNA polymerase sigma-70 factor, ECF subfamily